MAPGVVRLNRLITLVAMVVVTITTATSAPVLKNTGSVAAVKGLVQRVFSAYEFASPFEFKLIGDTTCKGIKPPCFAVADLPGGKISISGTTAAELAAGVGFYLRQVANMTIGWKRGGGSHIYLPRVWPKVGTHPVSRRRNTPWSYIMNVCTHSYSLVWYDWNQWEEFLDWMALSGINLFLALTGQEEVQYKVFQKLGLDDMAIRKWFNGPAFLTWSRGQNNAGSNIAGPLPRSWMKGQWKLQKQILERSRSLGMSGQLPGFQGNVPIVLKSVLRDSNMTDNKKGTAWMDALDPNYAKIADMWMKEIIADFGTDHWWQLDGYFNGGTAPWLDLEGKNFEHHRDLPDWRARGTQVYTGLNRTDPDAIWSYQGWAFVEWKSDEQAASLRSFIDAAPAGKFNVIDMSVNGDGEWKMWNNASFWGAPFIWTTLHDFGGTDGLKGWLARINQIPFSAPKTSNVWGTGFTPEGIDQNPVYYEFMCESNWREAPVVDIPSHIVRRSHRRYGLTFDTLNPHVDMAWRSLVASSYAQDLTVQDGTGVAHMGSIEKWAWDQDRPTPRLCLVWKAWGEMIAAGNDIAPENEPYRYDLVNTGREILAQITGPVGQNFTNAIKGKDTEAIARAGGRYIEVLEDLDVLVATDASFLLGPWIKMARNMADEYGAEDCSGTGYDTITTCARFYEWNARVQLTTWHPTPKNSLRIPTDINDYAAKHWSGLIKDYYAERVKRLTTAAVTELSAGRPWTDAKADKLEATLAYEWTTGTKRYPTTSVGDALEVSTSMHRKYATVFAGC
eukprot:g3537.t1